MTDAVGVLVDRAARAIALREGYDDWESVPFSAKSSYRAEASTNLEPFLSDPVGVLVALAEQPQACETCRDEPMDDERACTVCHGKGSVPLGLVGLLRLIGELDRECDGWGCIDGQIQDVNGAWMDCFKCDGSGRVRVSPDEIIEALVKAGVLDVVASAGALIICPDDLDSDADLYVTGWRPEPAVARSQGEPE